MIVPAMTYNEIIDEIKRDIPFVFDLSVKKDRKVACFKSLRIPS